jgi:prepilin-type N-terminal cleavage/methylation domain-containing protein
MRKGFTLIEVLIAVSITSILMSLLLFNASNYSRIKNEIDVGLCQNTILGMINGAKQFCREKSRPGYILFDLDKNEVDFISDNKKIDRFILPKGVSINSINTQYSRVDINKNGITSDAGTIVLSDNNGKLYQIVINVGTGYAEIK